MLPNEQLTPRFGKMELQKIKDNEQISFFGLKVNLSLMNTYAVLVLMFFFLFYFLGWTKYYCLVILWKNPTLSLCLNLVLICLLEFLGTLFLGNAEILFQKLKLWSRIKHP